MGWEGSHLQTLLLNDRETVHLDQLLDLLIISGGHSVWLDEGQGLLQGLLCKGRGKTSISEELRTLGTTK